MNHTTTRSLNLGSSYLLCITFGNCFSVLCHCGCKSLYCGNSEGPTREHVGALCMDIVHLRAMVGSKTMEHTMGLNDMLRDSQGRASECPFAWDGTSGPWTTEQTILSPPRTSLYCRFPAKLQVYQALQFFIFQLLSLLTIIYLG